MWDVREQNAIKIFSLPDRKISLCVFSLCAKWVKSCPNPGNIITTWKNLITCLSILDRMQWAKKPSHATVPLYLLYFLIWCEGSLYSIIISFHWCRIGSPARPDVPGLWQSSGQTEKSLQTPRGEFPVPYLRQTVLWVRLKGLCYEMELKVPSGQIGSAWEGYHWIGLEKDINRSMSFSRPVHLMVPLSCRSNLAGRYI